MSGSVVQWNGAARTPTTFVNANQLTATITAQDIAAQGTASVTVQNPGGATSSALPFTITQAPAPTPTLASLSPSTVVAGGPNFTLTVTGSNFVSASVVQWNGAARTPTTFLNANQLTATITAQDIAAQGTASVTVQNPGGATSSALPFTITQAPAPTPTLASLSPSTVVAGGPNFTLTVTGSNFVSASVVQWNGAARTPTIFVNANQLTATITAQDIAAQGTASVTVQNPGGPTSSALPFTITQAPAPTPTLASLSPSTVVAGGPNFTLTVTGSNFVSASVVRWNGAARITTFVNANQLTATITAQDIAAQGTASVTVQNPGGPTSSALKVSIRKKAR